MTSHVIRDLHTKTDPACLHYEEAGLFRGYLNDRGRGNSCHACVPPARSLASTWDAAYRAGHLDGAKGRFRPRRNGAAK